MRITFVLLFALLMVPLAQAQESSYIGCDVGAGGAACTETPYGHGDTGPVAAYADIPNLPDGSTEPLWLGPGDGSCNADIDPPVLPIQGQIWLRELDDCVSLSRPTAGLIRDAPASPRIRYVDQHSDYARPGTAGHICVQRQHDGGRGPRGQRADTASSMGPVPTTEGRVARSTATAPLERGA